MSFQKIPRRTFLRGIGTALSLPFLEAMIPQSALAQTGRDTAPRRLAYIFVPNGIEMADWTPKAEGFNYELPYILQPLQPLKDRVTILSGLTQHHAFANGDGGGDHARSAAAWLTGCQPRKTSGADIHVGISADQLAAQRIGTKTQFASIELGCERSGQAGDCDSGYSCAYSSCISWRSENTPVAKETNPRQVFERLFGNGDEEETTESRELRARRKLSLLDFVMEDAKGLRSQLGRHDQQKMDEYFSSVREIEQRLERLEKNGNGVQLAGLKTPEGVPAGYADHVSVMSDMMLLAFQADLTRVVTFMLANEGSNRSYNMINISEGHHELSHHGGDAEKLRKLREINKFHLGQVVKALQKMAAIQEGSRSLLDNCMIVYGGGISDGNQHNHDNLPIALIGRGGGTIRSGQHLRFENGTPLNNLHLSLLDRAGVHAETLGDSTGLLKQII